MLLHTTTEAGYPAVYINGGSIAARSIYSAQIQANAIVAEHLRAGQISSDHISTAGITADNIKGKTLSSSVPVSSGGSFINLDTGNINFAGGNLTWDNTTKTFYINASTLQIGGKNVLNTDTDLAQQINNKGTTRIQGNKLHFTNQVLMDDAFIELFTANNIFAQRIDARDINANRITSGTLEADYIQGGTFDGQSMIVKNITADAIKGGTFDGQSMTIRNLTADAIVTGTLDMSKFNVSNLSADDIQTGNLDISGGLRVTSGRHQIMSIDPETLNLEFNVNKMTIGGIKLISEDDQPQMEKNIANELEGKIKQYLHIAYADDASGNGFSTSPLNKSYLGIAVTNSATAPAYTGFTWSKYAGEDGSRGPQGLPGQKGDDGTTTYTWVRYADTPTSGMSQYPADKKYIGLAFNKTTQTESDNYNDYKWSLMPQNIEVGGRNLIRRSLISSNVASVNTSRYVTEGVVNITTPGSSAGARITAHPLLPNTEYVMRYRYRKTSGTLVSFGGHTDATWSNNRTYVDGKYTGSYHNPSSAFVADDDAEHEVVVYISTPSTITDSDYIYIQPNRMKDSTASLDIYDWKLEKGNTATDWSPSPEDIYKYVDDTGGDGRNYFTKENNISVKTPGSGFVDRGSETPNGFKITGRQQGGTSVRIHNVITSNGWWTVSFDIRGSQSAPVRVNVDINDMGSTQISTNAMNTYERRSVSVNVTNYTESLYNFVDFDNFAWAYFWIDNIKVEKGKIATDWSPAPEDTQAEIDKKASADDVASALMDLQQELEAAATASELSDFIQEYNKELAARESEKRNSESRLSKAQEAIDIITNDMRDRSESWNFLDRSISNTPEGMVIGNESTGSYLLIKEDKISFFSNGNEVAFISQNLMEISRGAFVEEIQISKYKLEGNTRNNHLTFRHVG